ncbi:hypothetical protein ACFR9U_21195 [Halorientalis brevis]|uniref:Uncharacterized protein n=1 Tax=Halorientalis brevis TaxID=1126241 RepID=A0ABD6CIX6_9EURY|nr:hypothetical protein [Halorientalis brevis]
MAPSRRRDVRPLFGALIVGFAFFLLINYLSLFGVVTVDSDLLVISVGVVIGYGTARVTNPQR